MSELRTAYVLEIFDKIGAPLMGAIVRSAPEDGIAEAQIMAALLAKTVQASIELGHSVINDPAQPIDDSLRVALAALSSPLVAGQFETKRQVPDEAAVRKIVSSMQAVLTFSENFLPSAENVQRMKEIEAKGQSVDPSQALVQYVHCFVPVVEAIAAFPFGQPEQKLMIEVSGRLVKKAIELRETFLPSLGDESAQKRAELSFLRALGLIYSAAHRAETEKALKQADTARMAELSVEPVWRAFETRAQMLEALAGHIASGTHTNAASGTKSPAAPPPAAAAPVNVPPIVTPQPAAQQPPPIFQAQPPQQPTASPAQNAVPPAIFQQPPAASAPPAAQNPAGASPLSMFAKKEDSAPPSAAPPAAPPIFQAPPQQPAAELSPEQPPASGGPMSFFKKSED